MVLVVHIPQSSYHIASHTSSQISVLFELVKMEKESRFIFYMDSALENPGLMPPNLQIKLVKPGIKNRLLQYYWYQFKLPGILKKEKATAFLSLQPFDASLKDIQYFIWLTDLRLLNTPSLGISHRKIATCFHQAKSVLIPGNDTAVCLPRQLSVRTETQFLPPPINMGNLGNEWAQADGSGYFTAPVCSADMHRLRILIKAFTLFKKRQRSAMSLKLIVPSHLIEKVESLLSAYKLKSHLAVIPINHWREGLAYFSEAYATLYFPEALQADELTEQLLLARKSLVCTEHPFWRDIYLEGAVYSPYNEEMISLQMMNLYKNESRKIAMDLYLSEICSQRSITATAIRLSAILSLTP